MQVWLIDAEMAQKQATENWRQEDKRRITRSDDTPV